MSDTPTIPTSEEIAAAAAFLGENSKVNEHGVRTMAASSTLALFDQQFGLNRAVMDSHARGVSTMTNAQLTVATEDLAAKIKAARDAGQDATGLRSEFRITTPTGSSNLVIRAQRSYPNQLGQKNDPNAPAKIVKVGPWDLNIDEDRTILKDNAEFSRNTISKALGLS